MLMCLLHVLAHVFVPRIHLFVSMWSCHAHVFVSVWSSAAIIGDVRTSMMEEVDFNKEAEHIQEVCFFVYVVSK
jgi:hypothetical protein